jgi:hypothetical protein
MEINEIRYGCLKHDIVKLREVARITLRRVSSAKKKLVEMERYSRSLENELAILEQKVLDCINLKGGEDVR